ncbi:MAG: hypothetical protein KDB10_23860 [Acidimicrobiales bacterium]|nr:hypothetical protein [Acidimicrobiales bacterium]
MGLLDKLSDLARSAGKVKDALEATGVGAPDASAAPAEPGRSGSPPGDAGGRSPGYRAIASRCVSDPFDLVTAAEVTEVAGIDVGPPAEWHSDDAVGAEFRGPDGWVRIDAYPTRPRPGDDPDAGTTWQFLSTETAEPRRPIDGLGDEAFLAAGDLVCVLVRDQVLTVSGGFPDGTDAAAALTAVARSASSRA